MCVPCKSSIVDIGDEQMRRDSCLEGLSNESDHVQEVLALVRPWELSQ